MFGILDNFSPLGQLKPIIGMSFADGDGAGGDGSGAGEGAAAAGAGAVAGGGFAWKEKLGSDLVNSPLIQKFSDTPEGLNEAMTSHLKLEKLLGHEKVPIPKDENDTEGWNRFAKAMGIPDKAEGYGLADADVPEGLKGATFNKKEFAEAAHVMKLTPSQTKALWGKYTNMVKESYQKLMQQKNEQMTNIVNQLKGEWGDAYQAKVELGQLVINKFSSDQESNDFITAVLTQDPRGIKFLAKIGDQFKENQIGDFKYQNFSKAPDEAKAELDKIRRDPNHPYNNEKASNDEHEAAVSYVNSLLETINKVAKG